MTETVTQGTVLRLDRPNVRAAIAADQNPVWPGTSRILQVPMYGLSVRERRGLIGGVTLLERTVAEGVAPAARGRWFDGYIEWLRDETGEAFVAGIVLHT